MGPGGGGDSWRSVGIGSVFRPGLRTGTGVGPNLKRDGGPKPVPHFFEEPPVTEGALDPELVRKVIHSHVSQIRFCYEQELSHKPDLAGRVRVRFTVNGAGDVPAASIAEGTNISDPELRACILSRVRGWQFPAPKGGGSAIVTYPFLLQPSGE
jgi:TonB family protein